VRQAQSRQLRYQELVSAQQQYPQVCQRLEALTQTLQGRHSEQEAIELQLDNVVKQLEQCPDATNNIQTLEMQMQQRRRQLDEQLSEQGRLQQRFTQLETLQTQYDEQQKQLQEFQRQYRVHQELALAFGKNGIQALMIENILPQLEAETNHILARLTGNQLHVQIVTQRAGRRSSKSTKLIDTLDILIADASGTRPYETYSGGEAFRINFSIRLALARLLAQRAGTSLQMLIVDEGFGTQDSEGCDRLIAAINAIASDFSCILTVTHMPQFKEAFQTRIEIRKTQQGSQLSLSM
jgi:exonuclease SbcC